MTKYEVYKDKHIVIFEVEEIVPIYNGKDYMPSYTDVIHFSKKEKISNDKMYLNYYYKEITLDYFNNKKAEFKLFTGESNMKHTIEINTVDALLIAELLYDNRLKNTTDKLIAERLRNKIIEKVSKDLVSNTIGENYEVERNNICF